MLLTGLLLSSGLALVAVEAVGYTRGGYNSAFWKLPFDDKLDHVSEHTWEWWWISLWELVGLALVTGGMFGLAALLAEAGEAVLANVALGIYVGALIAWVVGALFQAAAVSQASKQRAETHETPAWIQPFWTAAWVGEASWIIGGNAAYAVFGIALLQTDLLASWVGWAAVVGGVAIAVVVGATRNGFPQLALLVPALIGFALIFKG